MSNTVPAGKLDISSANQLLCRKAVNNSGLIRVTLQIIREIYQVFKCYQRQSEDGVNTRAHLFR